MNVLLDTNVLSEVRRSVPDRNVMTWLNDLDEDRAFLSVITIAELQRGVRSTPQGRRRDALVQWLEVDLPERFAGRIIPVDLAIAERWGALMAHAKSRGIGLSVMDAFIAATALCGGLGLATRNIKAFKPLGLQVVDPWSIAEGR